MRGGKREGSGRKPVESPKQIKSFTLSYEAREALKNLEEKSKIEEPVETTETTKYFVDD